MQEVGALVVGRCLAGQQLQNELGDRVYYSGTVHASMMLLWMEGRIGEPTCQQCHHAQGCKPPACCVAGEHVAKELEAGLQLHKYRTLKRRQADEAAEGVQH